QEKLVRLALIRSGCPAETISYIEAHGTGTALGDPIEIAALTNAFGFPAEHSRRCAIGSVKSNIGHLESAAGIAGLTKVLLQLQHGELVPSIHSAELNPNLTLNGSPFYIPQTHEPWIQPQLVDRKGERRTLPRRAGISSFGAGGANVHVIIEEAPQPQMAGLRVPRQANIAVFSARNSKSLNEGLRRFASALPRFQDPPAHGESTFTLDDVAYTLQIGREAMREVRLALVVHSLDELREIVNAIIAGARQMDRVHFGGAAPGGPVPGEDQESHELAIAYRHADLDRLAALWVTGFSVDWSFLYPKELPRRVSLPTYAFQKEPYWYSLSEQRRKNGASEVGTIIDSVPQGPISPDRVVRRQSEQVQLPKTDACKPLKIQLKRIALGAAGDVTGQAREMPAAALSTEAIDRTQDSSVNMGAPDLLGEMDRVKRLEEIRLTIREELSRVLYLEATAIVDDRPFIEAGVDSILGVELVKRLNSLFHTDLKATTLYEFPSVTRFAEHVFSITKSDEAQIR